MKSRIWFSFFWLLLIVSGSSPSAADDELFPPAEYIQTKLQQNDIVFLGTRHKQPDVLAFIAEIIPNLQKLGVTYIAVEVPSDQQDKIDTFMKIGEGLDTVEFHVQICGAMERYKQ